MSLVTMLLMLLAGTILQLTLPSLRWLGYPVFPVLTSLVLYYALYRGGGLMIFTALVAGLVQDSLSLIPPGYSSLGLLAGAMLVARYRDLLILRSPFTHAMLTAIFHTAMVIWLMLSMLSNGNITWQPVWLAWKIPGALLLGIITGPVVIAAAHWIEEKNGLIEGESERYGATRSFYDLG